jgi:mRNA interferase MazF
MVRCARLGAEGTGVSWAEATVKQCEIWWATLPLPVGRRPVLLLSRNGAYAYLNKVLVAEITATVRGIPQEVIVGRPEALPSASVVNLDNLHSVAKRQLTKRAGSLRSSREAEVKRSLGHALGWAELSTL